MKADCYEKQGTARELELQHTVVLRLTTRVHGDHARKEVGK